MINLRGVTQSAVLGAFSPELSTNLSTGIVDKIIVYFGALSI